MPARTIFPTSGLGRAGDAAGDCAGLDAQQCPLREADDFLLGYTEPLALAATGPASTAAMITIAGLLIVTAAALARSSRRPRAPSP